MPRAGFRYPAGNKKRDFPKARPEEQVKWQIATNARTSQMANRKTQMSKPWVLPLRFAFCVLPFAIRVLPFDLFFRFLTFAICDLRFAI